MVNKSHSPGGGKTSCAFVEELLLNSFWNTTGSFQSELQNLKVTPELAITEQQNCTGTGSQTFFSLENHILQLPWLAALL